MTEDWLAQLTGGETEAIEQDPFDRAAFAEIQDQADRLQTVVQSWTEKAPLTGESLVRDVFAALYKYAPPLRAPEAMRLSHRLNQHLVGRAMQGQDYAQLRAYTRLDDEASAIAACVIGERLLAISPELTDQAEQQAGLEDKLQQLQEQLEGLRQLQPDQPGSEELQRLIEASQAQVQATADQATAQGRQLQAQLERQQQTLAQAARRAVADAAKEVEATQQALAAWGLDAGPGGRMSAAERLALAQRIRANPTLQRLATLVGRFRRLALDQQATKFEKARDEIFDVTVGADLAHVLPAELMLLRRPATKRLFLRRYVEQGLLQYALRGREKLAKGPIIFLEDESGSMAGGFPFTRDEWAKAVGLALLAIATKQRRDFWAVEFGSARELLVREFRRGAVSPAQVLDFAEHTFGGGTNFEAPLRAGLAILKERAPKADLVFVTDGECEVSESFLEGFLAAKQAMEFRVLSVLIDVGPVSGHVLRQFSDQVLNCLDFASEAESTARELFGAL